MTSKDAILITVDCWRSDTVDRMDSVQSSSLSQDFAIAQGAATNGVFPSILASQYYPEVYDETGAVKSDCPTLPSILSDNGYSTGGFVASNPYLSKWRDEFDTFWNDGLAPDDNFKKGGTIENLVRLSRMESRVPAPDLLSRAKKWWNEAPSPRFLWLHFMDLHAPYLPGIRRVLRRGPIKSIRTLNHDWSDSRKPAPKYQDTYRNLYNDCVAYFDSFLEDLFNFLPNSASIVMTGDHGEGFNHDVWGHAQLYDEVVKVPFLYSSSLKNNEGNLIRHLDIPLLFLDQIGELLPSEWRGSLTENKSFIINYVPQIDETYIGYRDEKWKYIQTYERHGDYDKELYNIAEDPEEKSESTNTKKRAELEKAVESFVSSPSIKNERIGEHTVGWQDDKVASRLKHLGYVD
ncbi:sulfatase-like hydrolase/transferase [Haloarcula sp. 1CSR25-25]|uniref:sulfatase-like hydrolase/transferase n=1 Tax=Haloarcula sp. 1CSR25-25 TaxID=2862545 RepID=UPI002894DCC5|nr:sulfatase-like hydrolase/transferase [Haloarcula sp. 1CSR25-25]MDT3435562.1 sulfatase-like hydrolase/transferase [Haloarcula sp. 1CSR25-25]